MYKRIAGDGFETNRISVVRHSPEYWLIDGEDEDEYVFVKEDEKDDFIAGLIEMRRQEKEGA